MNLGSNIFELTASDEYWITDDDGDGWGGFGSSLSLPIEKKEGTLGVGGLMIKVTDPGYYEIILEAPESKTLIVSMHRVYKVDKIDCLGNVVESIYSLTDDDDISLGHSWGEYVLDGDQTCTEDGHKTASCMREGCTATNQVVAEGAALGHAFTNYVYNNDATKLADGTETAICDHGCGTTDTRTAVGTMLPGTVTAVNGVDAEKQHAKKYIENGMLIIEVDGVKYDVTGRVVK